MTIDPKLLSSPQWGGVGTCAGVWKTTDGRLYWENVSDGFFETVLRGRHAALRETP